MNTTDLTKWCRAFYEGEMTFRELTAQVAAWKWQPTARHKEYPDLFDRMTFDSSFAPPAPGSVDELGDCVTRGFITSDQFFDLMEAAFPDPEDKPG